MAHPDYKRVKFDVSDLPTDERLEEVLEALLKAYDRIVDEAKVPDGDGKEAEEKRRRAAIVKTTEKAHRWAAEVKLPKKPRGRDVRRWRRPRSSSVTAAMTVRAPQDACMIDWSASSGAISCSSTLTPFPSG